MAREFDRKLVLEDGSIYKGYGFGADCDSVYTLVFNTGMVGYQEGLSDPACTYQTVMLTYPLIGNCGIADEDFETKAPTIGGLVVREYNDSPSNFRYTKTLSEVLEENDIPAIEGVDTREIMMKLRDNGLCKALITSINTSDEAALKKVRETEIPKDAVPFISCKKRWYKRTANHKYNVVAIDCGVKYTAIEMLNNRGCNVTIVPYDTSAEEIKAINPDAVFISSGPGNAQDVPCVVETIRELKGKFPMFGIALGHQLIALAYGAKIAPMKALHSGGNHPVKNLSNGKIEITSQGCSTSVVEDSLAGTGLIVTHRNLLDNIVEGVSDMKNKIFSVQYHAESAPGPQDSGYLFDKFIDLMRKDDINA